MVSDSESHDDDPFMGRFFADPYFGRVVGGEDVVETLGTDGSRVGGPYAWPALAPERGFEREVKKLPTLRGRTIGLLGMAFKAESDDIVALAAAYASADIFLFASRTDTTAVNPRLANSPASTLPSGRCARAFPAAARWYPRTGPPDPPPATATDAPRGSSALIDTTSGNGLVATTAGTLQVSGTGNTRTATYTLAAPGARMLYDAAGRPTRNPVQPTIDASGNLTYTAMANAFGSATVTDASRNRNFYTLAPGVEGSVNLWWYPYEGIQVRLGYSGLAYFNTRGYGYPSDNS